MSIAQVLSVMVILSVAITLDAPSPQPSPETGEGEAKRGRWHNGSLVLLVDAELLAAYFAREHIKALSIFHHRRAVDDDGLHSRWMALYFLGIDRRRQFLADQIVDLVRIEDGDVGGQPFLQQSAVQAQFLGREAGDFVHGLFKAHEIFLAAPVA